MRRTVSLDERPLPTATELAPSLLGHVNAVALLLDVLDVATGVGVAVTITVGIGLGEDDPPPPPPQPARAIENAASPPARERKKLRRTCFPQDLSTLR
jgi:hypothetical protein